MKIPLTLNGSKTVLEAYEKALKEAPAEEQA